MSNIYRLVYTDSNSNQQVLAVQGTGKTDVPNSGDADYSIRNARLDRELRNINRLKIWAEAEMLGNVPLGLSEFEGDEPELFWQKYDEDSNSWFDEFRGYAENKGAIDQDGEFTVKLFSHAKYVGAKERSVNVTNSGIGAVVDAAVGSNYSVEVPDDVSPPIIDNYNFNDRIENLLQEITRNYGYNIAFTPNTNDSGQYVVRLEPIGYGGIVDTIAGKEDVQDYPDGLKGTFKEWEKERIGDVVNKVNVIGTDSNNNKIEETVKDQGSIDEYGEKAKSVKVDWSLSGSGEAQDIGEGRLNPDPKEGGKIRVSRVDGDVTNLSFEIVDSRRNITGAYTVVQETSFYPENTTYLIFEYESKVEEQAQIRKNVNEERAALLASDLQNIGDVDFEGSTGGAESDTDLDGSVDSNSSNTDIDGSVDSGESDTDLDGSIDDQLQGNVKIVDEVSDSFSTSVDNSEEQIAEISGLSLDATYHLVGFSFNESGTSDKAIRVAMASNPGINRFLQYVNRMEDVSASGFENGGLGASSIAWMDEITLAVDASQGGQATDSYELRAIGSGATSTSVDGTFFAVAVSHDHGNTFLTDDNNHGHTNSFITDDDLHGHLNDFLTNDDSHGSGTSSEGGHGASGTTDEIEADIAVEDKTNR